ncbi:hypothetical protein U9M48_037672 [Paspalum notatum var. saurae]|uniref:Uncharacterized protein n=1 Tax=Paspalum notatum var. saurae TaxID=547442 RepID=A0AAQ3XAW6_PASNO
MDPPCRPSPSTALLSSSPLIPPDIGSPLVRGPSLFHVRYHAIEEETELCHSRLPFKATTMFVFKVLQSPFDSSACSCRIGLHPDCGGRTNTVACSHRIASTLVDCGDRMLVDLLLARTATKVIDILLARAAPKVLNVLRPRIDCSSHRIV